MYLLFPVAYPIARLLDRLLGASHGVFFDRSGLKTLVMLHECLNFSPERLNREEVTVISSMLDLKTTLVSSIMTPISKVYTLSIDKTLDDITRYNILSSGYSSIPIHMAHHPSSFIGVLSVKTLVALRVEEVVTAAKLPLDTLLVVRPDVSCQDILHVFRDRSVQMVLVTERGTSHGEPLGIVTARGVMNQLIGE
jgi:metal transporter CNNM